MIRTILGLALLYAHITPAAAQLLDHTSSFTQYNKAKYIKINYDNDYFTATDYYYSQGITLNLVLPALRRNILNKLLYTTTPQHTQYGLAASIYGHTPTSIASDSILYGDRPYGANAAIKSYAIVWDTARQRRIVTALTIGVMGPAAKGYEIQYGIHKWIGDELPKGWEYQLKNAPIITYQLNVEQRMLTKRYLQLNGAAELRVGTQQNKYSLGANALIGQHKPQGKKAAIYLYLQARANGILYDAMLQGGVGTRNNAYTIAKHNVVPFTFGADAGIVLQFNGVQLTYSQSYLTKEFTTGLYHRWGGFRVGVGL